MDKRPPYFILLSWLWLAGLLLFMVMVTWDMGLLPEVLAGDQTRISVVLLILTALISLHCAYRSYRLSRMEAELEEWRGLASGSVPAASPLPPQGGQGLKNQALTPPRPGTFRKERWFVRGLGGEGVSLYLSLMTNSGDKNLALNGELLAEHFHYQHAFGWFAAGAMVKLGLLGTIIGFIMMLTSIGGLDSLDIEQVQRLMQQMTQGMMVALNTTLLGLVGSMILGVQYLLLDHFADQLLARTLTWVQQVGQQVAQQEPLQESSSPPAEPQVS